MGTRERAARSGAAGALVARHQVMDAADLRRAIKRIAHELVERNHGLDDVVVIGLQTGGVPLARRLVEALGEVVEGDPAHHGAEVSGTPVAFGTLDVAFYRDDIGLRPVMPEAATEIPFDITDKVVVLVDDVLFTGRTVRAALDALNDHGRARAVQLAVMVDRGHRELPIRPDYVGKNLPTGRDQLVDVTDQGVDVGTVPQPRQGSVPTAAGGPAK